MKKMADFYDEKIVSEYIEKTKILLAKPELDFLKVSSGEIPSEHGVYVIHDKKLQKIIYIGRTGNLMHARDY